MRSYPQEPPGRFLNIRCVLYFWQIDRQESRGAMVQNSSGAARAASGPWSTTAVSEYFAPQPTSSSDLPEPTQLLRNLSVGVLEVMSGVREIEQLARWMTEDVFRVLLTRANLATRARSARGVPASRPVHTVLSVRHTSPADGAVEAVVVVRGPARTRAIAIRLEGMDGRWRATSLALL